MKKFIYLGLGLTLYCPHCEQPLTFGAQKCDNCGWK